MKRLLFIILIACFASGSALAQWQVPLGDVPIGRGSGTGFTSTPGAGLNFNTLNAKTADYPITNTDCGKTIQAGSGSTGLFTVTLPAVSGFPATCSVSVTNGDTARGKRLSGFPAGVPAVLWPRKTVTVGIVNGAWSVSSIPDRFVVSSTITVFVDPVNGNDTNDCLAATVGACLTHVQAMTNISTQFVNNGITTIQWADATYADKLFNAQPYIGTGSIALVGNVTTPANVNFTISGAGNCIFCFAYVGGNWAIHGFKLSSSVGGNGNGLYVAGSLGLVTYGNMNFGALTGGFHITAIFGGHIEQDAIYTISGGAGYHLYAADDSILHATFTGTVTITGTPAFSVAFIGSHGSGAIVGAIEANYSGAATGTSCFADDFGLIDIINAALLPGNGTCTVSTTAQVAGVFANPQLGGAAYGGQGCVRFANATSGNIAVCAPTGALGTPSISLPITTGTLLTDAFAAAITNSLGGNVTINNATYTTGPTVAQGSTGTWFASGNVTIAALNGNQITCRLSDGTNVIDSGTVQIAGDLITSLHLSGFRAAPSGNLQILCLNVTANNGTMNATNGVDAKASTISAFRIQ